MCRRNGDCKALLMRVLRSTIQETSSKRSYAEGEICTSRDADELETMRLAVVLLAGVAGDGVIPAELFCDVLMRP